MARRSMVAAVTCVLLLGVSACGDDDDAGEEGASKEAYCAIEAAIDARFEEQSDALSDDATFDAAIQAVAGEIIEEHEDDARAAAPDEIADDVDTLFDAAHEVADGDPEAFNTPEVDEAGANVDEFCGVTDDDEAGGEVNALAIDASEYSFAVSGEPTAGTLTVELANTGDEIHEFAMGRLVGDSTVEDVQAAFDAAGPEEEPDLEGIAEEDGPIDDLGAALFPGGSLSITGSGIPAGDYVLLCFVPTADGTPHFSLGMLTGFTIAEGEATGAPEADATYTADADGVDGPDTLPAGETVLSLVNDSDISREIQVGKLKDGKTFDDADAFFAQFDEGPPTAEGLAGEDNPIEFFSFVFDADQDRLVTVDLTPGTWVIGMPDPENEFEGTPDEDPYAVVVTVT
jgi:hypothetical protein